MIHKSWFQIGLIFLISCLVLAVCYQQASQLPYGWADDDAYFYSQIAYNISTQGVSSFDGVNITDGYHLLWMGILASISFVVSLFTLDKNIHLYWMMVPSIFLILYIPYRFGRNLSEKTVLLGLSIMGKVLMETNLLVLLFLWWIEREMHSDRDSSLNRILLYAPAMLIPLTRIDASIMVFVFALYFLIQNRKKHWLFVNLSLCVGIALHFLIMHSISEHWFSVSSVIKSSESSWNANLLIENLFISGPGYSLRAGILFFLSAGCLYLLIRGWSVARNRLLGFAFLATAVFAFGHLYLSWLRAWYYIPGHLIFAYLMFQVGSTSQFFEKRLRLPVFLFLYFCIAGYLVDRIVNEIHFRPEAKNVREFISQIKTIVPEGELIFQRDGSGYTGYFSNRSIFNGDGLVNSHDYAQLVVQKQLSDVLDRYRIHYVISNIPARRDTIDCYMGLVVRLNDMEKILEKKGNGGYFFSNFTLYRRK